MNVFVTGGTGYIGRLLVSGLVSRGHRVRVLARAASTGRVPAGATPVVGNALDPSSYRDAVYPGETIVHLVGTPHPSPKKVAEFTQIDLVSINAAVEVASSRGAAHLVYVSVAHPAPVMHAYIAVRRAGEDAIRRAGLTATVLRPWYVLGPGHWWPVVLLPIYACAELIPSMRAGAARLGLVRVSQMVNALVFSVENPPLPGTQRILEVPDIRRAAPSIGPPPVRG